MSHIVKGKSTLNDETLIKAACRRLKLAEPSRGQHQLYSGQAEGLGVKLPGWKYPLVVDPATGQTTYDNYNECWGKSSEIDRLSQAYALERIQAQAVGAGFSVQEFAQDDGTVRQEITIEA